MEQFQENKRFGTEGGATIGSMADPSASVLNRPRMITAINGESVVSSGSFHSMNPRTDKAYSYVTKKSQKLINDSDSDKSD
jgi:hypothetical protein